MRPPRSARRLILVGLVAAVAFNALVVMLFVALRPVSSAIASGLIGAAVAGTVWWVFFTSVANYLERRWGRRSPGRGFTGALERRPP